MKKLPKLDLHGAQLMNDQQLKHILGGDGKPDKGYVTVCSEYTIAQMCIENGWIGTCQRVMSSIIACI